MRKQLRKVRKQVSEVANQVSSFMQLRIFRWKNNDISYLEEEEKEEIVGCLLHWSIRSNIPAPLPFCSHSSCIRFFFSIITQDLAPRSLPHPPSGSFLSKISHVTTSLSRTNIFLRFILLAMSTTAVYLLTEPTASCPTSSRYGLNDLNFTSLMSNKHQKKINVFFFRGHIRILIFNYID